jgi:hypothetical protein
VRTFLLSLRPIELIGARIGPLTAREFVSHRLAHCALQKGAIEPEEAYFEKKFGQRYLR